MTIMTLDDAMRAACNAVGIKPPARRCLPGRWTRTDTLERNGKNDAEVMIQDDQRGVSAVNWQTMQRKTVRVYSEGGEAAPVLRRDPEKERRQQEEQRAVEAACAAIVKACRRDVHPYLARKGFPQEMGLVCDDPRPFLPAGQLGEAMGKALPEGDGPLLIVPGRIGGRISTVQFITAEGAKKNVLRGVMNGAAHRIATGRETWVCEGIATALSINAALRLLGRSATVLSAFSASNVAKVASGLTGALLAADHDKPVETFGGLGTGEYYARRSGRTWVMPPEIGDFNDMHMSAGLRAVALFLREVKPP